MEHESIAQNWEPSLQLRIAAECGDVHQMAWNGSNRIAVSGRDQIVYIHDFDQSLNSHVSTKLQEISHLSFAKKELLLVSSLSGYVSVFKLSKEFRRGGNPVVSQRSLRAHGSPLFAMDVDPKGTQFLTAGADKIVKLWSMSGQKLLTQFRKHTNAVRNLAFSWDGSQFVSAADDRETIEWDVRSSDPIATIQNHGGGPTAVAYLPDGHLVVAHRDNTFRVYEKRTRSPLMSSQLFDNPTKKISVHSSGQFLAMCSETDQCAAILDLVNGSTLTTFTVKMPVRQTAFLSPGYFSANDFDTSDLLCLPGRCRKLNIFNTNLSQLVDDEDRSATVFGEDKENTSNNTVENSKEDKPVDKEHSKPNSVSSPSARNKRMTMARKTIMPKRISMDDEGVESTPRLKEGPMSPFNQSLSLSKLVTEMETLTSRMADFHKRFQRIEERLTKLESEKA